MTHTPGPWRVDYAMGIRGADNVPLAYVLSASSSDPTLDAQLMAAAPELLEALETMLKCELEGGDQREGLGPNQPGTSPLAKARAAIAKADLVINNSRKLRFVLR